MAFKYLDFYTSLLKSFDFSDRPFRLFNLRLQKCFNFCFFLTFIDVYKFCEL